MVERTTIIKKLGILSVAKIYGVFGVIWGILMGAFVALGIGAGVATMGLGAPGALGAGIVGFILTVIFGAVMFFIMGVVVAFVYNVIADIVGGIEMQLDIVDYLPLED
ncbi:MAG TPA: DUF3566 domain-containing protein [Methanoregulaceae archaeon]|nr:DUF3566 domain-containing protein [Methanoregulaceae archaeon]